MMSFLLVWLRMKEEKSLYLIKDVRHHHHHGFAKWRSRSMFMLIADMSVADKANVGKAHMVTAVVHQME